MRHARTTDHRPEMEFVCPSLLRFGKGVLNLRPRASRNFARRKVAQAWSKVWRKRRSGFGGLGPTRRRFHARFAQALCKLCACIAQAPRREDSRFSDQDQTCAQKSCVLCKSHVFVQKSCFLWSSQYLSVKVDDFVQKFMILIKSCKFEATVIYFS